MLYNIKANVFPVKLGSQFGRTVSTIIVATEDLKGYRNSDFSADYKGFAFDIKKGCLLAIGGCVEIELNKQKDELENTSSIFSIVPNLDPNETIINVDISSTKPKIVIISAAPSVAVSPKWP